jgi:hypothetical protein
VEAGRDDFVAVLSFAGRPMKRKECYIARLDEVYITCEGKLHSDLLVLVQIALSDPSLNQEPFKKPTRSTELFP